MSYILDALHRAAAERQGGPGSLPTQHEVPPHTALQDRDETSPDNGRTLKQWFYATVGCAVVLAATLAWWLVLRPATTHPVQQAPQPTPVAAPILAPTPVLVPASAPAVEPPLQQPSAHEATTTASKPLKPANTTQPKVATTIATPSPTLQTPLYSAHDLPDNIRANLPKLVISGASYSENPAHRMLIANGQIYREAEEVAPGLHIERINAKDVIFTFQGYRYTQNYP